ncbi:MAG: PAS domain-containing protein [Alphaproteobacteria bacterium]|nr:MAG: PAS domain-containing protein [Alphaproteobacteria bacterium]
MMDTTPIPRADEFESFLAYWRSLQAPDALVPSRVAFNPMQVRLMLPFVYMLELRAPDNLHVRLSGTALDGAMGRAMTGENYLDFCEPGDRAFFLGLAKEICGRPCGGRLVRRATFQDGKTHNMRQIGLPLSARDGEVKYIIGLMSIRSDFLAGIQAPALYIRSEIRDVSYIDIGFGVPPNDAWRPDTAG